METKIIIVDKSDNDIGSGEKLKVHEEGKLHRAFSIFIFNSDGKLLLQRRSKNKYHSRGLWSNTVCSHPKPDENLNLAVHNRLKEEMGFDCKLEYKFKFHYKVVLDNLIENEIDHVFIGKYDNGVKINPDEVSDFKWMSLKELQEDIIINQNKYTAWFRIIINKYTKRLLGKIK